MLLIVTRKRASRANMMEIGPVTSKKIPILCLQTAQARG
jgi:hypothetical protein